MNRTKIPWADFSINPVKGLCPMACPYCYARRMYKRFKWDETIRFDEYALYEAFDIFRRHFGKERQRIFVGSTMELFGDWVKPEWMGRILQVAGEIPQHTFIFLTKQPQNLSKYSPFPDNCWVGVSVTANGDMTKAYYGLSEIKASVKFLSVEPLLGMLGMSDHVNIKYWLDWLILGSRTQPTRHPPRAWVDEIIAAADKAKIPVFVKEPMASFYNIQRQEFPALPIQKE